MDKQNKTQIVQMLPTSKNRMMNLLNDIYSNRQKHELTFNLTVVVNVCLLYVEYIAFLTRMPYDLLPTSPRSSTFQIPKL